MAMLPSLERSIALLMVTSHNDPEGSSTTYPLSEQLADVFSRNAFFDGQLREVRGMCSEGGQKIFDRAVRRYKKSPRYQSTEISALDLMQRFNSCDEKTTGEQAQAAADQYAEQLEEEEAGRLRDILRDQFGIESWDDWYRLIDARRCIAKSNPELLERGGLKNHRAFAKRASELTEASKSKDCTPSTLIKWRETKDRIRQGIENPLSIIPVPGGGHVWGNGEPVQRDRQGNPRRRIIDIFGKEVAENEKPDIGGIGGMVDRAYRN